MFFFLLKIRMVRAHRSFSGVNSEKYNYIHRCFTKSTSALIKHGLKTSYNYSTVIIIAMWDETEPHSSMFLWLSVNSGPEQTCFQNVWCLSVCTSLALAETKHETRSVWHQGWILRSSRVTLTQLVWLQVWINCKHAAMSVSMGVFAVQQTHLDLSSNDEYKRIDRTFYDLFKFTIFFEIIKNIEYWQAWEFSCCLRLPLNNW